MFNHLKKIENPFLLFAPFLLLYVVLVFIFPTNGTEGDQSNYLIYARYIIDGTWPKGRDLNILGNGPGYPILLIPFVALKAPLIFITLLNAILYYLSLVLLFKTSQQLTSFRKAMVLTLFWACYYTLYEHIVVVVPEVFTSFLVCCLAFCVTKSFTIQNEKKLKIYTFLSGFIIAYLALTKPIFGYVLMVMIIGTGIIWILKKRAKNYKKAFFIVLIGFTFCLPYLAYTYNLTNKLFYWSSSGGNNLYWMSTPYDQEFGNWFPDVNRITTEFQNSSLINDSHIALKRNHQKDFDKVANLNEFQKDSAFKKMAIDNIRSHPVKFIKNCIGNASRIVFNYPYSYTPQKISNLIRFPLNGIILFLMFCSVAPAILNWKKILFPLRLMLFFALIYLGGSVLGSAETRMFTVVAPIFLLWIGFVFHKTLKINLKYW